MSPHQFLMAVSAVLLVSKAAHAEPPKAAVFDFQLANLGAQSPTDEDQARLGPLTDLLRQQLQESGRYQIVSTDPVRAEVEKSSGLRKCGVIGPRAVVRLRSQCRVRLGTTVHLAGTFRPSRRQMRSTRLSLARQPTAFSHALILLSP